MAAAVVAAIDALEATLNEAVQNSKIMNTLDREISKALGLLVDLILLPFLPLLVGAIISLYGAVIEFGKWWNNVTTILEKEGILGLVKASLEIDKKIATDWVENLMKFLFGTDAERSAAVAGAIKVVTDFFKTVFGWTLLPQILEFLFGQTNKALKSIDFGVLVKSLTAAASLIWKIVEFIFTGMASIFKNVVDFTINLGKGTGADLLWSIADKIINGIPMVAKIGVESATGMFQSGYNAAASINPFKSQTTNTSTTNKATTSNNNFNFYGLQPEQLPDKIMSELRKYGAGFFL